MILFGQAMNNREEYSTLRFDFCGYDGMLWYDQLDNG